MPLEHWIRTELARIASGNRDGDRQPGAAFAGVAGDNAGRIRGAWSACATSRQRTVVTDLRWVGVVGDVADQVVRTTHGHPFALALLADIVVRGGSVSVEPLPPDLLRALVDRFLDVVPTKSHRQALGVCSIARITTYS